MAPKKPTVIALDGPVGAAHRAHVRFTLLDNGAIYRTVALAAERANVARTTETYFRRRGSSRGRANPMPSQRT
jgi:cytidylate kinase